MNNTVLIFLAFRFYIESDRPIWLFPRPCRTFAAFQAQGDIFIGSCWSENHGDRIMGRAEILQFPGYI